MKRLIIWLLRGYQTVISPLYGQTCRYYPSCSAYALRSIEVHGALRGSWAGLRRLGRCHPWTPGGVDLVPRPADYRWWGIAPGYDGSAGPSPDPGADPTCDHRHLPRRNAGHLTHATPDLDQPVTTRQGA